MVPAAAAAMLSLCLSGLSNFVSLFSLSLPPKGLGDLANSIDYEISSGLPRCCAAAVIEIIDYEEPVPPEDEILDSDDQARVIACQISMKANLGLLYVPM